ncbi:LysE family translocator [Wenzhouxiangella sp. EGI_FJ10305]|uniref:LysE family translocator n=1 Tax=Wenzhouxiangella sp. EGI_FJ10305 TaxID=3243768 RepID=UPI0035DCF280
MTEAIIALVSATALLLGSPGPAPLALAGTSAAFGVRRGLPFLLGILAGLSVAIIGATAGLAALFQAYPAARLVVQVLGGVYICYVALKIATAPVVHTGAKSGQSAPRFLDGFILNLLNPKAYAAFVALFSQFLLPFPQQAAAFVTTAIICLLVAAAVDFAWLCFGGVIGPLFKRPRQARIMRVTFAVAMVGAVLWVFMQ